MGLESNACHVLVFFRALCQRNCKLALIVMLGHYVIGEEKT